MKHGKRGVSIKIALIVLISELVLGMLVCFVIFQAVSNPNHRGFPPMFSREATVRDITVTDNRLSITGYELVYNPNCDIDRLTCRFTFRKKSNGEVLEVVEKSVGNVKEGVVYVTTVGPADVASVAIVTNILDVECIYSFIGTVSYF